MTSQAVRWGGRAGHRTSTMHTLRVLVCAHCNVSTVLGPTVALWMATGCDWDPAFHEWCVTCIMLKVTAGKVDRLATRRGLGVVWDCMRSHYAREARQIAKRETRRWCLTVVLRGHAYGGPTIFSELWSLPEIVDFVVSPQLLHPFSMAPDF